MSPHNKIGNPSLFMLTLDEWKLLLSVMGISCCTVLIIYLFPHNLDLIVSANIFLFVCVAAIVFSGKIVSFLSWHVLIPVYYLIFLLFIPLYQQWAGIMDYSSLPGAPKALMVLSTGIIMFFLFGHFSLALTRGRFYNLAERIPLVFLYRPRVIFVLLSISWAAKAYSITQGYFGLPPVDAARVIEPSWFDGVATVVSGGASAGFLVSWYCHLKEPANSTWRHFAWVTLLMELVVGLVASSKAALIYPLLSILIIILVLRKKVRFTYVSLFLLFVMLFVVPYISFVRVASLKYFDESSRLNYFYFLIQTLVSGNWIEVITSGEFVGDVSKSLGRQLLYVLSTIVATTGDSIPFSDGNTYLTALGVSVPRIIWPSKPDLNIGNYIGLKYGLIANSDLVTNISPSQPGEMYMNFGWIAVVVGMSMWGFIATFFYRLFGTKSWYTALLVLMVAWQEGSISPLLLWSRDILVLMGLTFISYLVVYTSRSLFSSVDSRTRFK